MDNTLIKILWVLGTAFLFIFFALNPSMSLATLMISIPFVIVAVLERKSMLKMKREFSEGADVFQREKEEIFREMKKREERQKEQLEQLTSFGRSLASAFNKEQLLHLIVEMFAKATKTISGDSQCFLLSYDTTNKEFVYEVGYNFDQNTLVATEFKDNIDALQQILKTKKIITYIGDIFEGTQNSRIFLKEERIAYLSQLGSLALIPMVLEDEVWGLIVIFCHEEAVTRIKNEIHFFTLLLVQASIALGNAIHRGLASVDKLTQLYNRAFLQKRLQEEMEFCNRQQLPMSILMIDIDYFKTINDSYGHQEGDIVLKKIAQILSKSIRLTDICSRYGGEEFVIVLPGIAEVASDKFSIAERLRLTVESTEFIVAGRKTKITISLGVMVRRFPEDKSVPIEELIKKADALLYKAKNTGRNRVCYADE